MPQETGKGVVGLGSTIGIGPATAVAPTSGETYTTIGQMMSIKPSGYDASIIKYSLLNGGLFTKKLASIRDAGQVQLEIARLGGDAGQVALAAASNDLTGQPYDFQIQLPIDPNTTPAQTTAGDTVKFSAIISKYNPISSLEPDKLQMLTVTLDLVTALTVTAGS